MVSLGLGWRSGFGRIRSRVGLGWIRVDSEQPAGGKFAVLHGHFDPTEMDSGFGRIRSRVGFGWIRVDS